MSVVSNAGSNSGSLADLQRAFQDYLLQASDGFAGAVRDSRKADRHTLLGVYRDAYALRLIEVLTNDYPGLMAMAGPADFDHMALAYIAAHPSRHPSRPPRSMPSPGGKRRPGRAAAADMPPDRRPNHPAARAQPESRRSLP